MAGRYSHKARMHAVFSDYPEHAVMGYMEYKCVCTRITRTLPVIDTEGVRQVRCPQCKHWKIVQRVSGTTAAQNKWEVKP